MKLIAISHLQLVIGKRGLWLLGTLDGWIAANPAQLQWKRNSVLAEGPSQLLAILREGRLEYHTQRFDLDLDLRLFTLDRRERNTKGTLINTVHHPLEGSVWSILDLKTNSQLLDNQVQFAVPGSREGDWIGSCQWKLAQQGNQAGEPKCFAK